MLEVRDIHTFYGKIHALKGVSLVVDEGEIVTLIGSNGAGKTTTLNTICGICRAAQGQILLYGEDITHLKAHDIVARGIGQSPEGRKIFARLTVRENLEMGAYTRNDSDGIQRDMEYVFSLFPRLKEREKQPGGTLSGGEQQMLAIGRALMGRPRLICMDEPTMGLSPLYVDRVLALIQQINTQGYTIFMVEQNANLALQIAHRGYVLQNGRIVMEGQADALLNDPEIQDAYLGEGVS